jgi:hypothetical protein
MSQSATARLTLREETEVPSPCHLNTLLKQQTTHKTQCIIVLV